MQEAATQDAAMHDAAIQDAAMQDAAMHDTASSIEDEFKYKKYCSTLTDTQREFVKLLEDWCAKPRKMLITVSGGPGTGKTYAVCQTLEFFKQKPLKMAFTGRAARAIGGRTIHSTVQLDWYPDSAFRAAKKVTALQNKPKQTEENSVYIKLLKKLENNRDVNSCIKKSEDIKGEFNYWGRKDAYDPEIIVVDDVSMISGWLMYWLIQYFMDNCEYPLLFIMMGDRNQLGPVQSKHNSYSVTKLIEYTCEVRDINLVENKRFTPKYEVLMNELRDYIDKYTEFFKLLRANFRIVETIDTPLLKQATRAMAFTNSTVDMYNKIYIEEMMPGETIRIPIINDREGTEIKYFHLKPNCLIFVNENVDGDDMNGTKLTFIKHNTDMDTLECIDDDGKEVSVTRSTREGLFPIDVGFAGTVHKLKGETIESETIVINFDGNKNLKLVYTALSRVRDSKQILAIAL